MLWIRQGFGVFLKNVKLNGRFNHGNAQRGAMEFMVVNVVKEM